MNKNTSGLIQGEESLQNWRSYKDRDESTIPWCWLTLVLHFFIIQEQRNNFFGTEDIGTEVSSTDDHSLDLERKMERKWGKEEDFELDEEELKMWFRENKRMFILLQFSSEMFVRSLTSKNIHN